MKKTLALMFALALALSLAACGESEETDAQKAARALDAEVWGRVTTASDDLQALSDFLATIEEGGTTDAIGVMVSVLQIEQDSLDELTAETQSALLYVGAARAYIANARVVYEKLQAFLVAGEQDDYDDFLHYYEMIDDLTSNAVEKRQAFLSDAGFSDEEIAAFPAEIRDEN